MNKKETLKLVSQLIHKGYIKAQICSETNTVQFHAQSDMKIGRLPHNDRSEIEFLQKKHLESIKTMIDANDRFMDLFVN